MFIFDWELETGPGQMFYKLDSARFLHSMNSLYFLPDFFASLQKQILMKNAFQPEKEYFQYTEVPCAFSFGFLHACMCYHRVTHRWSERYYTP